MLQLLVLLLDEEQDILKDGSEKLKMVSKSKVWCLPGGFDSFFIESFPQMYFEGKWLQHRL